MRSLRVIIFGTDPQSRNQYIILSVAAALRRDPRVGEVSVANYLNLVEQCQSAQVDLFLAIGGAGAIALPVIRAAALCRRSLLWTIEDPYEQSANVELASHFDLVFSNDRISADAYGGRARFLPLAGSTEFHDVAVRESDDEMLWDVFFAGTAWPNRVRDVSKIVLLLNGRRKSRIALPRNWALDPAGFMNDELYTDFRLAPREYAKFANRARVTLTLDREFSTAQADRAVLPGGSPPPRLFEMALAGACQIYLSQRPDSASFYEQSEVFAVQSIEGAVEAIDRIAADPSLRRKMASSAQNKTRRLHTYDSRVRTILDAAFALPIQLAQRPRPERKRVLHVTHNIAGKQPFGGVELYQTNLASMMPGWDAFYFYPDRTTGRLTLVSATEGELRTFEHMPPGDIIYDHRYNMIFQDVLSELRIDLVHYQHLIGHPMTAPLVSRALGIPSVLTAHDYYTMCDSFNLLDHLGSYCAIGDDRIERCDVCTSRRIGTAVGAQARRRWVMAQVLQHVDAVCHNTRFTKNKMAQIYPGLEASKHRVVGMMGSKNVMRRLAAARHRLVDSEVDREGEGAGRLKIVVLGNLTKEKGGDWLIEVIKSLASDSIDFEISGRVDDPYPAVLASLDLKNVNIRGPYKAEDLPDRLIGRDVSVHMSVWPETYCISVDEARAAGLVPVVSNVGALGERVVHGENGFSVPLSNPMELVRILRLLNADRSMLTRCRAQTGDTTAIPDQHVEVMTRLYNELAGRRFMPHPDAVPRGYQRMLQFEDLPIRFNSQFWKGASLIEDSNEQPTDTLFLSAEALPEAMEIGPPDGGPVRMATRNQTRAIQSIAVDDLLFGFGSGGSAACDPQLRGVAIRLLHRDDTSMHSCTVVLSDGMRTLHFATPPTTYVAGRRVTALRIPLRELGVGSWQISVEYERDNDRIRLVSGVELTVSGATHDTRASHPALDENDLLQARRAAKFPTNHGHGHVDRFGEGLSGGETLLAFNKEDAIEITIKGWLLPRELSSTYEAAVLCLTPEGADDSDVVVLPCRLGDRMDVIHHFGVQASDARAGFIARLPLKNLREGKYGVAVVARYRKGEWRGMRLPDMALT